MKKRWMYLLLPVAALVLELLPYGAVCNFANPEGDPWRRTYSYFDLVPFGYANFAPFLTAIFTWIVIVLLLVYLFVGKRLPVAMAKKFSVVCFALSLCPLLLGVEYYSVVGLLITLCLFAEALWLSVVVHRGAKEG